jgi:hypothetical protein
MFTSSLNYDNFLEIQKKIDYVIVQRETVEELQAGVNELKNGNKVAYPLGGVVFTPARGEIAAQFIQAVQILK